VRRVGRAFLQRREGELYGLRPLLDEMAKRARTRRRSAPRRTGRAAAASRQVQISPAKVIRVQKKRTARQ